MRKRQPEQSANVRPSVVPRTAPKEGYLHGLAYHPSGSAKLYYLLWVHADKAEQFQKCLNGRSPFNVKEYATILASGEGDPPEGVLKLLRQRFEVGKKPAGQPSASAPVNTSGTRKISTPQQREDTFNKLMSLYDGLDAQVEASQSINDRRTKDFSGQMIRSEMGALDALTEAFADWEESGNPATEEHGKVMGQAIRQLIEATADFVSKSETAYGLKDSQDYAARNRMTSIDDLEAFMTHTRERLARVWRRPEA